MLSFDRITNLFLLHAWIDIKIRIWIMLMLSFDRITNLFLLHVDEKHTLVKIMNNALCRITNLFLLHAWMKNTHDWHQDKDMNNASNMLSFDRIHYSYYTWMKNTHDWIKIRIWIMQVICYPLIVLQIYSLHAWIQNTHDWHQDKDMNNASTLLSFDRITNLFLLQPGWHTPHQDKDMNNASNMLSFDRITNLFLLHAWMKNTHDWHQDKDMNNASNMLSFDLLQIYSYMPGWKTHTTDRLHRFNVTQNCAYIQEIPCILYVSHVVIHFIFTCLMCPFHKLFVFLEET